MVVNVFTCFLFGKFKDKGSNSEFSLPAGRQGRRYVLGNATNAVSMIIIIVMPGFTPTFVDDTIDRPR